MKTSPFRLWHIASFSLRCTTSAAIGKKRTLAKRSCEKSSVSEPTVARLDSVDGELGGRNSQPKKSERQSKLPVLSSSSQMAAGQAYD